MASSHTVEGLCAAATHSHLQDVVAERERGLLLSKAVEIETQLLAVCYLRAYMRISSCSLIVKNIVMVIAI